MLKNLFYNPRVSMRDVGNLGSVGNEGAAGPPVGQQHDLVDYVNLFPGSGCVDHYVVVRYGVSG
jgi:hypothetical protein